MKEEIENKVYALYMVATQSLGFVHPRSISNYLWMYVSEFQKHFDEIAFLDEIQQASERLAQKGLLERSDKKTKLSSCRYRALTPVEIVQRKQK